MKTRYVQVIQHPDYRLYPPIVRMSTPLVSRRARAGALNKGDVQRVNRGCEPQALNAYGSIAFGERVLLKNT